MTARGGGMTPEQLHARAVAYEECAALLCTNWTHDKKAAQEGLIIARNLRRKAARYRTKAIERGSE